MGFNSAFKGIIENKYFGNFRLFTEDHFWLLGIRFMKCSTETIPVCLETEKWHKKASHVFVHCLPSRLLHGSPVWSLLLNHYDDTSWIFNVVVLPKDKFVKLAALNCKVGGGRFAVAVDASNILTDVFHVFFFSAQPRKLRNKYPTIQPRPLLSTSYPVFYWQLSSAACR